ncbi:MAG: glycerate kinase [Candidatus Binatia bacterium]
MNIVVAMDSFKGSLAAGQACDAVARGLAAVLPSAAVRAMPMADGGEGTAAVLRDLLGGENVQVDVHGPLPGQRVRASFARIASRRLDVVEMAAASGLTLVPRAGLDPMVATTYGTGELLREALRGGGDVWLSVGGSATVDGGVGAAMALGWRFEDARSRPIGLGGAALERIVRIVPAPPSGAAVDVLCDVENPLLGPKGAARTFGPQKGATPEMVERLEAGLANLAARLREQVGVDVGLLRGGGAAGGLAAGAVAFLGARLVPGIDRVMICAGLPDALRDADWVVTGEGRFDATSLEGKVVSGVIRAARAAGVCVAVLAGQVALAESDWRAAGVSAVASLCDGGVAAAEAMARAAHYARRAAEALGRSWSGAC